MKKPNGEQVCLDNLIERIGDKYIATHRNVSYKNGEIDLIGKLYNGLYDIYEVKSTDHNRARFRAKRQLTNIRKEYGSSIHRLFYYVCKDDNLFLYEPKLNYFFRCFDGKNKI